MPSIFIGKSDNQDFILNSSMMNRHGIITGSTGSGKTVTMNKSTSLQYRPRPP